MPENTMIFLTGMPAAGKTYWGLEIARAHGLLFVDLDYFIIKEEQASMQALFAQYGEAGFRERETKHLKTVIANAATKTVVACGGGTPCFGDNMQLMKAAGTVVYLEADVPTLMFNLDTSDDVRPMLQNRGNLALYLENLMRQRKSFYEQAHHILQTKNITLTTFDKII